MRSGATTGKFTDVKPGHEYMAAISIAAEYGLIGGYADDTYKPDNTITREEAMTILARTMKLVGMDVSITDTEVSANYDILISVDSCLYTGKHFKCKSTYKKGDTNMNFIKESSMGLVLCLIIAIPSWILGINFPIIGSPVIALIAGMIINLFIKDKSKFDSGIKFTSKKILQYAVILLGFGLNLSVVLETGKQSFPIIVSTITTSLVIAFILHRVMQIPSNISTLVGVGSSICGGSAIAATAPVINADNEEVAQAISIIFLFNVLAAILFPSLGAWLGFSHTSGNAFGIFAGTAINDTSSVTAAASTWDSMYNLGSATLDKAVTVKLTRTLAIIPITMLLAFVRTKGKKDTDNMKVNIKKSFPFFIIYFVLASIITTIATGFGVPSSMFVPFKELSKFFITLSMVAIGLNTDIVKLIKSGGKPIIMGFCCWLGITVVSLMAQHFLGIW